MILSCKCKHISRCHLNRAENPDALAGYNDLYNISYCLETIELILSCNVYWQKQKETLNELANNLIAVIDSAREDWEGEQSAGITLVLCHTVFGESRKLGQSRRLSVDQGNPQIVCDYWLNLLKA